MFWLPNGESPLDSPFVSWHVSIAYMVNRRVASHAAAVRRYAATSTVKMWRQQGDGTNRTTATARLLST